MEQQLQEGQTEPLCQTEQAEQTAERSAREEGRGERVKGILRAHFTAPHIAYMALFTALAYAVSFLEFPIFPQAGFLKLDFANVFFLIEAFIFGPVEAVVSIGIKELLSWADSQTAGVGEVANLIMSFAYIIVPAIGYRFKKGKKWVVFYLALACVVQIGVSLLVNRYINFPFFGVMQGFDGAAMFDALWPFVLYFNIIKSVGISILVFFVYKPLSRFIKMTSDKFDKRMANRRSRSEK